MFTFHIIAVGGTRLSSGGYIAELGRSYNNCIAAIATIINYFIIFNMSILYHCSWWYPSLFGRLHCRTWSILQRLHCRHSNPATQPLARPTYRGTRIWTCCVQLRCQLGESRSGFHAIPGRWRRHSRDDTAFTAIISGNDEFAYIRAIVWDYLCGIHGLFYNTRNQSRTQIKMGLF